MTLSANEIVELSKRYTLYDWSAQSKVAPMAVDRAEGVYFYGVDGTRYLDFNSQLMGVNIGHGDKRVIDAIAKQCETLAYITPFAAYETRALLGQKLATLWPGDMENRSSRSGSRGERERDPYRQGLHRPGEGHGAVPGVSRRQPT
jgi:taurine--2-oxoglutarate transaminase